MTKSPGAVYKRDFWADENTKYARPHYRMLKVARLVNRLAVGKDCRLLDVGCGPATLGTSSNRTSATSGSTSRYKSRRRT